MLDKPGLCWSWPERLLVACVGHPVTGTRVADAQPEAIVIQSGFNAKEQRRKLGSRSGLKTDAQATDCTDVTDPEVCRQVTKPDSTNHSRGRLQGTSIIRLK